MRLLIFNQYTWVIMFVVAFFIIAWAMVGYPLMLLCIDKFAHIKKNSKNYDFEPTVTVMVVAHNEEKVINAKLENLVGMNYPSDKYKIIVTSDCSTDRTNKIVRQFIEEHRDINVTLYETIEHKGKTNAQNEAQRLVDSEILIMTDSNCMFDSEAIKELVACLKNKNVGYVCGQTVYVNEEENLTAQNESIYWKIDSKCKEIESNIQTITAGDGNIYACRTKEYVDIPLIQCHDASFPIHFALNGQMAKYNPMAVSYEKAGENNEDEYKRKVRMNRNLFYGILPSIRILNFFKYKWFTIFYLGHRTCRYLLWISHLMLLIANIVLAFNSIPWLIILCAHILVYICAFIGMLCNIQSRGISIISFYVMTVISQWNGFFNIVTGKARPTWEKAETTR